MRFHLDAEQIAIQDSVRGTIAETWGAARLQAFADGEQDFDTESWQALMQLGLAGVLLPESGMGLLDAALVSEAIGEGAAPGPFIGQVLAAAAVAFSDNPAVKPWLDGLVEGGRVATLAFDGELVQSARAADLFLVDEGPGGLCLIEAGEGVLIEPVASTDRSRPVSRVRFDGAKSHRLFAPGDAMIDRLRDVALVLVAADCLGGAQHCVDASVGFAKERHQFGQPIGRFQGLKHQLAQMALEIEPARALVWYAAYAWDAGLPDAQRTAALAKAHLCEVYTRATRAAIAAHGGIGYTWEFGLHNWFRRAILNRAWLGSPTVLRARAADLAGW